jgi:phosphoglycolate phosphatase-like HAD superfamily hydrolase
LSKHETRVLIVDVDNTLFDWFAVWHASFSAMILEVEKISGIEREKLYPEIRAIHQRVGTSEYSLLLSEIPSLVAKYGKDSVLNEMGPAIDAFRNARRKTLKLYDTVADTLLEAKSAGTKIVAYTESQAFYTSYRFKKLGLDTLVDILFSPPDHQIPDGTSLLSMRAKPPSAYEFAHTKHFFTPKGELKPNPKLLGDILAEVGADARECIYVGDSLFKDIAMAKDAGVLDFHAEYGASHSREEYQLLVGVTHWNDEDVEFEKRIQQRDVAPTYRLSKTFGELSKYVSWRSFK